MARIAGVDLPKKKRIEYALTYIYGIGLKASNALSEIMIVESYKYDDIIIHNYSIDNQCTCRVF